MGYAATHGRKCAIVIPATLAQGATHANFPVCFTQANLPVAANEMFDDGGTYPAKSDGSDIRFSSDEAGDTPMNVEVERFAIAADPANGYAEIWVCIPSFSYTVDTTVYCWWNDPDATAVDPADVDEGSEGVWDANFKAVYHLSEAVNNDAGGYKDATANDNHMTGTSMALDSVAGAWTGSMAADFDGSADFIQDTGTSPAAGAAALTVSAWVKSDSAAGTGMLVEDGSAYNKNAFYLYSYSGKLQGQIYASNYNTETDTGTTISTSVYEMVAVTWASAAAVTINRNGADLSGTVTGSTQTGSLYSGDQPLTIGARPGATPSLFYNGKIDEVRLSTTRRANAWLAAEYAVINSIASITPGTPESPGGAVPAIIDALISRPFPRLVTAGFYGS